ncbi:hypothetical protein V565_119430 [Rhizoctonia solani 123E]|uniref:Uncharacterized protein n=1 Tax=Rhizoctonia solani 123E TaxID=1423351 RepID=A0A074RNJ8_9AGAM|nr:hypothetical protein V565_119430 [Rhizoctonia solani 123E]
MVLTIPEQSMALIQEAHADPDVEKLTKAYQAMELMGKSDSYHLFHMSLNPLLFCSMTFPETQLWVMKHVRPDQSYFLMHKDGPAGFGKDTKFDFTWGWGPIVASVVKAEVDLIKLYIEATVSVNTYILGTKEAIRLKGNLKDGVEGSFDIIIASGFIRLFLKNGFEIWVKFEVSSPLFGKIEKELMITKF